MDDPFSTARLGERWTVRHRLGDGSATDTVGWLTGIERRVELVGPDGEVHRVERTDVILARRAPAALGGPAPSRTAAETLEQIALPGWLGAYEALGAWTLRSADGFTGRANSCLAVGDPGMPIPAAAERIVAHAARRGIPPWAQVIIGSEQEAGLLALGWRPVYVETDVLAVRLADLLGRTLPDPHVRVSEELTDFWEVYAESRPYDIDPAVVRGILDGRPPRAFATVRLADQTVAIARGHLNRGWLGLAAIWTRPEHRRRGWARGTMLALGHWAARRGARWAYLQVARDNGPAISAYEGLGFSRHHRYRYLTTPHQQR